jgi:hypothetical protein
MWAKNKRPRINDKPPRLQIFCRLSRACTEIWSNSRSQIREIDPDWRKWYWSWRTMKDRKSRITACNESEAFLRTRDRIYRMIYRMNSRYSFKHCDGGIPRQKKDKRWTKHLKSREKQLSALISKPSTSWIFVFQLSSFWYSQVLSR